MCHTNNRSLLLQHILLYLLQLCRSAYATVSIPSGTQHLPQSSTAGWWCASASGCRARSRSEDHPTSADEPFASCSSRHSQVRLARWTSRWLPAVCWRSTSLSWSAVVLQVRFTWHYVGSEQLHPFKKYHEVPVFFKPDGDEKIQSSTCTYARTSWPTTTKFGMERGVFPVYFWVLSLDFILRQIWIFENKLSTLKKLQTVCWRHKKNELFHSISHRHKD